MAASMTYRRDGPMGGGVEIPQAPPAPRPYLGLTAGDVLRRVERRAYDEEPILERTRQALKSEARSTGIAVSRPAVTPTRAVVWAMVRSFPVSPGPAR